MSHSPQSPATSASITGRPARVWVITLAAGLARRRDHLGGGRVVDDLRDRERLERGADPDLPGGLQHPQRDDLPRDPGWFAGIGPGLGRRLAERFGPIGGTGRSGRRGPGGGCRGWCGQGARPLVFSQLPGGRPEPSTAGSWRALDLHLLSRPAWHSDWASEASVARSRRPSRRLPEPCSRRLPTSSPVSGSFPRRRPIGRSRCRRRVGCLPIWSSR